MVCLERRSKGHRSWRLAAALSKLETPSLMAVFLAAPVLVVMLPWDRQHRNWRYPRQEESVHLQLGVPTRTPGGIVLTMPGSADVTMAMTVGQYRAWVDADPGLQELAKVMHQQAIARGWVADLRTNPDPAIWLVAPPPPAIEN